MRDGNVVGKVQTSNTHGDVVLGGSAEVAQWEGADAADAHLLAVYGFLIVKIFKDSPKQKTAQSKDKPFANVMSYDTMDKDTEVHLQSSQWPSLCHSIRSESFGFDGEDHVRGSLDERVCAEGLCLRRALFG